MKVYKNAYFERFAKKNKIADTDLIKAVERVEKGLIDADLGSFLIKQRIPRKVQSRARGYRTIISCIQDQQCYFVYGYAKSEKDNLTKVEEREFKKLAQFFSTLSDAHLQELIKKKNLIEVKRNG